MSNNFHFPLEDQTSHVVVMHLLVHFSGNFEEMLSYYQAESKGCVAEITLKDIEKLQKVGQNRPDELAEFLLSDDEKHKVTEFQSLYRKLKEVYNKDAALPKAIADLILAEEDEEDEALDNILSFKDEVFLPLLDIVSSEIYYDPLSPGYGKSPILAIKALGQLKKSEAIPVLFNVIGHKDFFIEDAAISALVQIGSKAQEFLVKNLQRKPINKDNENAAIALNAFPANEEVALASLSLLQEKEVKNNPAFSSHLILNCAGLSKEEDHLSFKSLVKKNPAGSLLQYEIDQMTKNWKC